MERSNPFFEEADDDETSYNPVEYTPPIPVEPTFTERLRAIFELEDSEEDEEDEPGKQKRSMFQRLFSRVPGVVDVDTAGEKPLESRPEPTLPLGFLRAEEVTVTEAVPDDDEVLLAPHHVTPQVVHPEAVHSDEAEEPETMPVPLPIPVIPAVRAERPAFDRDTSPIGDELTPPLAQPEAIRPEPTIDPETKDHAAKRKLKRKLSAAKSREKKIEGDSKKRDKALRHEIEAQQRNAATEYARLRKKIEQDNDQPARAVVTPVPGLGPRRPAKTVEQSVIPPKPIAPIPKVAENTPRPRVESRPRTLEEAYIPDVHDRIPPQVAFEQLTGMEQPLPRSLEQERRHEIKDDPSKVPVAYMQADPSSPWQQQADRAITTRSATPSAPATGHPSPAPQAKPKPQIHQTYKTAVMSGVVSAVVILAIILVIAAIIW